jgi:4-diphosphocytidyl-2-C-methyl-D-erythritol kinase
MASRAYALAPAKINIGLEIIGKRRDGFHGIVAILQTISLYDRLEWSACHGAFSYESPTGIEPSEDLTRIALDSAPDRSVWTGCLRLQKAVPLAAGLGGGSSDAALALRLAHPDATAESLFHLATPLGSDIPFFLEGGTSLVTGAGTEIERLPFRDAWCVIVTPRIVIPNKTRTLYASITADDYSDGAIVRHLARTISEHVTVEEGPPNAFTDHLMAYPEIHIAYDALRKAGTAWVSISGAGPSLYTLVRDYSSARAIADRVPPATGEIFVARTLPRQHDHLAAKNLARLLRGGSLPR